MRDRRTAQLQQQRCIRRDGGQPRPADDDAAATPSSNIDEMLRLQDPQSLAKRLPRDTERRRHLAFGRQLLVDGELAAQDLPPQVRSEEMGDLAGPT